MPTRTMRIEPCNIPPRKTTDIVSLIVKTTPIRIYGYKEETVSPDVKTATTEMSPPNPKEVSNEETKLELGAIKKTSGKSKIESPPSNLQGSVPDKPVRSSSGMMPSKSSSVVKSFSQDAVTESKVGFLNCPSNSFSQIE